MAAKVETMQREQTPEKLLGRGKAFATVADYTRAEQYLSAALEAGADPREALPLLLRVCVADHRYRAAIAYAEEHARKHPTDTELRYLLGTLYAGVGEVDPARSAFESVLRDQPDNPETHYALAALLREAHTDPLAQDQHFRAYLKLRPNGEHADEARAQLLTPVPAPENATP